MKRPACLLRQTGACRRCGPAACQPCRGHEEPVGATDLSATGRRTPTDRVGRGAASAPSQVFGGRSDQLQAPNQSPAGEAINLSRRTGARRMKRSTPTRRTGVQRAKDQRQTSTAGRGPRTKDQGQLRRFGPSCLRRTNVKLRIGSIPSWETLWSTRATGITHPGFYGRKPWRKPNSEVIIAPPGLAKEGLRRPFSETAAQSFTILNRQPHAPRPGRFTTARTSGRA